MPELPIATETVDCGFFGSELAALVQQVANRMIPHTVFIARPYYYNGTVRYIGQAGASYRHLRVVPDLNGPHYIRFKECYPKVEITSFLWDPPGRYPETPMVNYVVREVIDFASQLREAIKIALDEGFPKYVDPEPISWEIDPQ